uniref:Uncharacterized protein n=1 Tax=Setaria digitata TaxID=48799 RepID=A0A915Q2B4_9BILA
MQRSEWHHFASRRQLTTEGGGCLTGVNKACEPIALLPVLLLLLLLLHSSSEFVQSAAAPPIPVSLPARSPWNNRRGRWVEGKRKDRKIYPFKGQNSLFVTYGEGVAVYQPDLNTTICFQGSPKISTNTNSNQDVHELSAMQRNEQAQAEQMFLLALHERLAQQLRPQTELQRIWQNMMLGLPALLPPLDLTTLPGTSQALMHPLYQVSWYSGFQKNLKLDEASPTSNNAANIAHIFLPVLFNPERHMETLKHNGNFIFVFVVPTSLLFNITKMLVNSEVLRSEGLSCQTL